MQENCFKSLMSKVKHNGILSVNTGSEATSFKSLMSKVKRNFTKSKWKGR